MDALRESRLWRWRHLGAAVVVVAFTARWFNHVRLGAFGFDDVGAMNFWTDPRTSLWDRTIDFTGSNRWRPIFTSLLTLETEVFGHSYPAYFWFNVALTALLGLVVYRLVTRFSSSAVLAGATALLAVTARFAYYQVTQALGPVESLALVLLVLLVTSVVDNERSGRRAHLWWMLGWYALLVHTHERYIVVALFLGAYLVTARRLSWRERVAWCIGVAAVVGFNFAIKHFGFDLPLLVGTGSATTLGFSWNVFGVNVRDALLQVGGVNTGLPILHGYTYPYLSTGLQIASIALLVLGVALLVAAFATAGRAPVRTWPIAPGPRRAIVLGVVLVLALILSFAVTQRVEPRFIYGAFIAYLCLLAYCAATLWRRFPRLRAVTAGVLVAMFALSMALNVKAARTVQGVYFMGARQGARAMVGLTVGRFGDELRRRPAYVIDPTPNAAWSAGLTALVQANSDLGFVPFHSVAGIDEVPRKGDPIVFDATSGALAVFAYPATGWVASGEWYADGWAGKSFVVNGQCSAIALAITPYLPGHHNRVTVSSDVGRRTRSVDGPTRIVVGGEGFDGTVRVTFERTYVPAAHGGQDNRRLAAQVAIDCTKSAGGQTRRRG